MNYTLFDGIALGDALSDPANPKPFRLFAVGENKLTRDGSECKLTLSAEDIRAIAEYHTRKGEKIPIDSRHALFLAAEHAKMSESDAARAVPSRVAALGFAALEAREDGLYAVDVEMLPLASELFRAGSLRYWSPVIRGLDGKSPLRVTSIAMDNVPALNDLDILAAGGEIELNPPETGKNKKGDRIMSKTETALRALLGDAALALSDDTDAEVAGKLEALAAELPELRTAKTKLAEMQLSAETAEKTRLVDLAITENRAVNAEREGLLKLPVAWLAAELPKRPQNAAPAAPLPAAKKDDPEALSAEEKAFAKKQGIPEADFLKAKKECGDK